MKITEEKACLCALNRIFGFEPRYGIALTEHLGSAREVFGLSHKDLDTLMGPHSRHKGLITYESAKDCGSRHARHLIIREGMVQPHCRSNRIHGSKPNDSERAGLRH